MSVSELFGGGGGFCTVQWTWLGCSHFTDGDTSLSEWIVPSGTGRGLRDSQMVKDVNPWMPLIHRQKQR